MVLWYFLGCIVLLIIISIIAQIYNSNAFDRAVPIVREKYPELFNDNNWLIDSVDDYYDITYFKFTKGDGQNHILIIVEYFEDPPDLKLPQALEGMFSLREKEVIVDYLLSIKNKKMARYRRTLSKVKEDATKQFQ